MSGRPHLLVTELLFHSNPKENGLRKLVQIFKRDTMVGSKVMAILTRYSILTDQTSSSPSNDSIETPRKTASTNSCNNLSAIQRSDQKLCQLLKSGWIDLVVTEYRLHRNPKENGHRKLVQIFKRDTMVGSKVMAILTRYSILTDQTSSSPSNDLIETPRKTASKNSCKNLSAINGLIKSYAHFNPLLKSGRTDLLLTE